MLEEGSRGERKKGAESSHHLESEATGNLGSKSTAQVDKRKILVGQ